MKVSDPIADHLPQINEMIQDLELGRHENLYQLYGALDQAYGTLYGIYADELNYLAADEPLNEVAERVGAQFVVVQPYLAALRDDLSLQDYSTALETLQALKDETATLYSLFGEYREVSEAQPKLSEIPYLHELVRVTRHYLNGELSIEAVQGRFEFFCQYHEALEAQLAVMVPSPQERDAFEESREDLEEALNLQMHGMEDLDVALERNEQEAVEEALEALLEAGDVLVEVYHKLQRAETQPKTISCIRCSAENTLEAKICGACGAVLPQWAASAGPTSTIALEEDGSRVGPQESEEINRLQKAVDEYLSSGLPEPLQQAIESYARKLKRSQRQFQKLEAPPEALPSEHAQVLQEAHALFAEALSALSGGLERLQAGLNSGETLELERGMDDLRAGSLLFSEFQRVFQKAQQLSN